MSAQKSIAPADQSDHCPGAETVLGYVRGTLEPSARAHAEEHAANCDGCRVLISNLARAISGERVVDSGPMEMAATELADSEPRAPSDRPPALPVFPGVVVAGKYRVEEVLGAGGMGFVVSATHVSLKRKVAMKFLLPELAARAEIVARFLREARAAARLESDHVVKVIDVDVLPTGTPYIVMEHLEGRDLAQHLGSRGKLPCAEAVAIVIEACDALAEAHAKGLVHRDLKPANLFWAEKGDGARSIKVLDFGIAKSLAASESDPSITSAANPGVRVLLGTPRYMSPEQARGATNIDARSDVWSIGLVLYELCAGQPAFEGPSAAALLERIATEPPPPLTVKGVPTGVARAVAKCLERDPERRFQSMKELVAALAPFAPPSSRALARKIAGDLPTSRRTLVGGVAIAIAVIAAAATAATLASSRHAAPIASAAEPAVTTSAPSDKATVDAPSARTPASIASEAPASAEPVVKPAPSHTTRAHSATPASAPPPQTATAPNPADPHGLGDRK